MAGGKRQEKGSGARIQTVGALHAVCVCVCLCVFMCWGGGGANRKVEHVSERKEAMRQKRTSKRLSRLMRRCGINIGAAPAESKSRSRWQTMRVALPWTALLMARGNKYHVFHQRVLQIYCTHTRKHITRVKGGCNSRGSNVTRYFHTGFNNNWTSRLQKRSTDTSHDRSEHCYIFLPLTVFGIYTCCR